MFFCCSCIALFSLATQCHALKQPIAGPATNLPFRGQYDLTHMIPLRQGNYHITFHIRVEPCGDKIASWGNARYGVFTPFREVIAWPKVRIYVNGNSLNHRGSGAIARRRRVLLRQTKTLMHNVCGRISHYRPPSGIGVDRANVFALQGKGACHLRARQGG